MKTAGGGLCVRLLIFNIWQLCHGSTPTVCHSYDIARSLTEEKEAAQTKTYLTVTATPACFPSSHRHKRVCRAIGSLLSDFRQLPVPASPDWGSWLGQAGGGGQKSQLRQGLLGYTSDSSVHVCPPWPWQPRQSYLAALGQPVCPPQHSPARPTLQHRPRIDDSCASYSSFSLLARLSTSPKDAVGTSQLRRGRFCQDKQTCHSVSRASWGEGGRLALVSGHLPTGQALDLPWKQRLTQLHARPQPLSKTADSSLPILRPFFDRHLVFIIQKRQQKILEIFFQEQSIKGVCLSVVVFQKEPVITLCTTSYVQYIVINTQTTPPWILTRKALLYQLYRPLTFAY